jgi:transcriptional regulator with XRE-family HTH domain
MEHNLVLFTDIMINVQKLTNTDPMKTDAAFAGRIKELVRRAGSAEKLALMTGMSARAIGQYAAGTSDPTRKKIIALADASQVNILWLMTGEGPKESG